MQIASNIASKSIFGLCNNYAYVIMLSAAEDILKQSRENITAVETKCLDKITSRHCTIMTTGAVLLADILPCLFVKLSFPFFMQRIPFGMRHFIICLFQALSYLIVAFSSGVAMSLIGVIFASVSSGLGEITYLSLTPYFNRNTISTWSSGTGGAGIIGSLTYAALTEPHFLNLSPRVTLLIMLFVPLVFTLTYWWLLIIPDSIYKINVMKPSTWIVPKTWMFAASSRDASNIETQDSGKSSVQPELVKQRILSFTEMLLTTLSLLRFMIPLMLVYLGEYVINQGILQLIVYSCDKGWNLAPSSQYRWYQVLYQAGVFISRSSVNIVLLPYWALILLPILQFANVFIFFFESLYFYIPHIWLLFLLILFEGLFGGSSYVNTFTHIHNFVKPDVREFSMSISSLGDSIGIVIAGFASIPLYNYVCQMSMPAHLTT
uniref:Battenin n=1 Tax=Elaeophora elaphi TaxID=1147741 RepID=A0A0R3RPH2_9BILA